MNGGTGGKYDPGGTVPPGGPKGGLLGTNDSSGISGATFGRTGTGGTSAIANSGGIAGIGGTAGRWIFDRARSCGISLFLVLINSPPARSPGERASKSELRLAAGWLNKEWRLAPAPSSPDPFGPLSRARSIPNETAMSATNPAAVARARRRIVAPGSGGVSPLVTSSCAMSPLY